MFKNVLLVLTLITFGFISCDSNKDLRETKKMSQQMKESMTTFQADLDRKLAKIDSRIEKLEKKAKNTSVEAKEELTEVIEEIKDSREDLGEKVGELKDTSKDKWEDVKLVVEHKVEKLQNEVEKAFN